MELPSGSLWHSKNWSTEPQSWTVKSPQRGMNNAGGPRRPADQEEAPWGAPFPSAPEGPGRARAPSGLQSVNGRARTTFPSVPRARGGGGGGGRKRGPLPGWRLAAASAVCLLPAAPVRECQAEEGTRRSLAAAPPAPPNRSREAASERASERGREEPGPLPAAAAVPMSGRWAGSRWPRELAGAAGPSHGLAHGVSGAPTPPFPPRAGTRRSGSRLGRLPRSRAARRRWGSRWGREGEPLGAWGAPRGRRKWLISYSQWRWQAVCARPAVTARGSAREGGGTAQRRASLGVAGCAWGEKRCRGALALSQAVAVWKSNFSFLFFGRGGGAYREARRCRSPCFPSVQCGGANTSAAEHHFKPKGLPSV